MWFLHPPLWVSLPFSGKIPLTLLRHETSNFKFSLGLLHSSLVTLLFLSFDKQSFCVLSGTLPLFEFEDSLQYFPYSSRVFLFWPVGVKKFRSQTAPLIARELPAPDCGLSIRYSSHRVLSLSLRLTSFPNHLGSSHFQGILIFLLLLPHLMQRYL